MGLWETLHNPDFKRIDFDTFKKDAGTNAYVFSIKKWNDELKGVGVLTNLTKSQINYKYADEADMLNVALFGMTAKEWRDNNKGKKGNIRDYATLKQLLVLANMESYNALLINNDIPQHERIVKLRELAISELKVLEKLNTEKLYLIEDKNEKE